MGPHGLGPKVVPIYGPQYINKTKNSFAIGTPLLANIPLEMRSLNYGTLIALVLKTVFLSPHCTFVRYIKYH